MIHVSKETLHQLVDELPAEETGAAARFLEFLRDRSRPGVDWAELRARLEPFAEEWESPEMALYDDYDNARGRP
jgi:hypothetical protein